jgi:hypothetical protein
MNATCKAQTPETWAGDARALDACEDALKDLDLTLDPAERLDAARGAHPDMPIEPDSGAVPAIGESLALPMLTVEEILTQPNDDTPEEERLAVLMQTLRPAIRAIEEVFAPAHRAAGKPNRGLQPRAWSVAHTRLRHSPRTMRVTRTGRHTTVSRVCAFSAGPKQSGADDDGPGGDPPDAARLAASITRFGPPHAARLEPPAHPARARRGALVRADDYLGATLPRLIGRAR